MFGKKYTFESRKTRIERLLVSGAFLFILSVAVIGSFIVYIPIYAKMQKGRASGAFFQKSPDAIAVFTGDKGRISYAMELLKKNPSSRLFISGVHAANSFQTLIDKQANPLISQDLQKPETPVDLDYNSKNTFENVNETVKFLRANPDLKKILIISSDYHIMRIQLIISHFMGGKNIDFFFDSVPNKYDSWDETRKLLKEAVKIGRTWVLLKIFRNDVVEED